MLLVFAFTLRVAVVLLLHTSHAAPVTYEHGAIAANLIEGRGFSIRFLGAEGPTSQQAPLYPLLLAGCYALLGVESSAAILAMQILQCLVGTSLVAATVRLAEICFPQHRAVKWFVAMLATVHPVYLYAVTHIQVCLWVAALLAWLVVFSIDAARSTHHRPPRHVAIGVLAGVLLLFEPIMALAVVILAIAIARTRPPGFLIKPSALNRVAPNLLGAAGLLIGCSLVVAPWIYRNWRVHGEWVFIKSTFGYAFWQGNNPASRGTDKIPKPSVKPLLRHHDHTPRSIHRAMWEARHETIYIDDLLLKPTGYAMLRGLSEPARSRQLGREALRFVRQHPGRYAQLCGRRLRYFLLWDDTNPKAAHWLYRFSTLAWLALATTGIWLAWHNGQRQGLLIVASIFAAVMLFHTLTITSARFRIPVESLTFPWAGYAAMKLLSAPTRLGAIVSRLFARTATT